MPALQAHDAPRDNAAADVWLSFTQTRLVMSINPEYLRRNLLVAKAIGARANAGVALDRLQAHKRPPKWLVDYLRGIVERCEPLPADLARWRDLAEDAPEYVKSEVQRSDQS